MENYSLTQQLKNFGISNIEVIKQFVNEFGDKTNFENGRFNQKIQIIDAKKQDDITIVLLLMEKSDKKLPADDFRKEIFVLLAVAAPSRRTWLYIGDCCFSSRLDCPVKYGGPGLNLKESEKWQGRYKQVDPITGKTPSGADSELDYYIRYGNYLKFNKIIKARYYTDDCTGIVKEGYYITVGDDGHEDRSDFSDGIEEFVGEYWTPRSRRFNSLMWVKDWKETWRWKWRSCG